MSTIGTTMAAMRSLQQGLADARRAKREFNAEVDAALAGTPTQINWAVGCEVRDPRTVLSYRIGPTLVHGKHATKPLIPNRFAGSEMDWNEFCEATADWSLEDLQAAIREARSGR